MIRNEVGSFEQYLKSLEWEMKTHNDSLGRTMAKNAITLPSGQSFNNTYQVNFDSWKDRLTFMTEKLKCVSFEHLVLLDQYIIYTRFKS